MKRRTITISFDCDAPKVVIEEIAEQMRWQLDSLNDGTLEMATKERGRVKTIDEDYWDVEVKVK